VLNELKKICDHSLTLKASYRIQLAEHKLYISQLW